VVALMEVPHWSVFEFGDFNFLELWLKSSSLIARLMLSRLGARKLVFTPKTVLLFKEVHWFLECGGFPGESPLSLYFKLC
jgi:hypothetical protein